MSRAVRASARTSWPAASSAFDGLEANAAAGADDEDHGHARRASTCSGARAPCGPSRRWPPAPRASPSARLCGISGHALVARDDVVVQVEHRLAAGRLVELHDGDAVGGEGRLHRARDLLHEGAMRASTAGRHRAVARGRLRHDERMPRRLRHDIHEDERVGVLVDLWDGISPRRILAKMLLSS